LYGVKPMLPCLCSAVLFVCASLCAGAIKIVRKVRPREPVTVTSLFAGVSYIKGRPVILGTLSLDLFAVLLGGVTALLPIFARDILHAGPWGLGFLRSAPAIGAVAMSIVLARMPLRNHVGLIMFAAVAVFGLATIVFSLSTSILLSVMALMVLGAADTISVVVRSSLVQLLTPDDMRGRVNAVNSLFIGTSNQLGEFESGMVAGLIGTVTAGMVGGLGTLAVVLLWMWLFPAMRKVKTLEG
jgi:MFS family permease